jgi:DNA-binding CsgD family transcriptional regulator
VRAFVPSGFGAFFWVDAGGDMTNMYSEKMLPAEATSRYFTRHYESAAHAFRDQVLEQIRRGQTVCEIAADAATLSSDYFRDILEPLGAIRMLRAVLHERGTPLGQLSLYRSQGAPAFSRTDVENLEGVVRYLQQLLRRATPPSAVGSESFRESGQAALLICRRDGRVLQASGRGHALLAQASGCRINRSTIAGELEQAGIALLRQVLADVPADAGLDDVPSQGRLIINDWGAYRMRAYPIEGGCGVLIERYEHLLVRLVDAMGRMQISSQQRQVALLLARGLTNAQVAHELGVSLNTACYHVRQLFAKLDAHDRAEVIARVLDGHTMRH